MGFDWRSGKSPRELRRKLRRLDRAIERALRNAIEEAALLVERTAKRLAPVDTGNLRSSIRNVVEAIADGYRALIGTNVDYAEAVEFGTGPHLITPNTAEYLRFEVDGEVIYEDEVNHPGTAPQPFLGPAINENERDILDIFERHIERAITSV